MTHRLGHDKNQPKSGPDTRNGYPTKTKTLLMARRGVVLQAIAKRHLNRNGRRTTRSGLPGWITKSCHYTPETRPQVRLPLHYHQRNESLNSVIRHAIKKGNVLPMDKSVKKGVTGNTGGITDVDDAAEGLAYGDEPLYYRVR